MTTTTPNKFALLNFEPTKCDICPEKHYSTTCPFICTFCFNKNKNSSSSSQTTLFPPINNTVSRSAIIVDGKDITETVHHSHILPGRETEIHRKSDKKSPKTFAIPKKSTLPPHIESECPLICPLCPGKRHHYRNCSEMCIIHKYTADSYAHKQSDCTIECFWCKETGHTKNHCIHFAAHIERKQRQAHHGFIIQGKVPNFRLDSSEDFPNLLS